MANKEIIYQIDNKFMGLDIYLCRHCNLRCRGCSRFCNISKPEFYDFETLKNDLKKIADTNIKISRFTLTGGEPLLYPQPQLKELIVFTRSLFQYPIGLSIFTNGKLIKDLKPDFLEVCRDYKVAFTYTDYAPIDNKLNKQILEEYDVRFNSITEYADERESTFSEVNKKKKFFIHTLSKNIKDYNPREKCFNDCPCLWDSKIWLCGTTAFIDSLNEFHHTDFKIEEKDYLKIDDLKTIEDYLKFIDINDEKPFCRYCCTDAPSCIEWEQGKGTIEDFVK